jgi:hypothetical protein
VHRLLIALTLSCSRKVTKNNVNINFISFNLKRGALESMNLIMIMISINYQNYVAIAESNGFDLQCFSNFFNKIWSSYHINYRKIFKFNHHYSKPSQIVKRASIFTLMWIFNILFYIL